MYSFRCQSSDTGMNSSRLETVIQCSNTGSGKDCIPTSQSAQGNAEELFNIKSPPILSDLNLS